MTLAAIVQGHDKTEPRAEADGLVDACYLRGVKACIAENIKMWFVACIYQPALVFEV